LDVQSEIDLLTYGGLNIDWDMGRDICKCYFWDIKL